MKRQTLETVISALLAEFPETTGFKAIAYELTHDGQGWSANDVFCIASDCDRETVKQAARGRWEIFKLNYSRKARVSGIEDISSDERSVELEADGLPFLRIETQAD